MNPHKKILVCCLSSFLVACSVKTDIAPADDAVIVPSSIINPTGGVDKSVMGNNALGSLFVIAQTQESKGNLQGAATVLARAIRIAPRNPEIYLRLAELSYRQRKFGQAQAFAEKSLSLNANQGLTEQAERLLKKISNEQSNPNSLLLR